MTTRDRIAAALAGLVLLAGAGLAAASGSPLAAPAAVSAAALVSLIADWYWPPEPTGRRVAWPVAVAGVSSLAGTVATVLFGPVPDERVGAWTTVEAAALLLLFAVAVRWAPARWIGPAAGLAGIAASTWILRFLWYLPEVSVLGLVGGCALWALPLFGAGVAGGYPRLAEARRARAVAEARRDQRFALAGDLHDFVAHDVSGMVTLAQAAALIAATDPDRVADLLTRIEAAGQRALSSMDRTVGVLRVGAGLTPPPGLAELADLADRFAAGGTRVRVDLEPGLAESTSREVGGTVHRIVVEALTNVRRHAPGAAEVRVTVARTAAATVAVAVANDGPLATSGGRVGGGFGLVGLAERVGAHGGTLTAGPDRDGWTLVAELPEGQAR